ncbi:MAG: YIP1 family protein [Terriglobales bacterium]
MSTTPASAAQPPLSETARILNTFIAPTQTFADIRCNQSWWVPWLLMAIVSLGFVFMIGQKVGFDQVMRNEMAKSPSRMEQLEKLPPDQRERQLEFGVKITTYVSYASPIVNLVLMVAVAGIFFAIFNFGASAEITFKQSLAIVMYSWLPFVISALLGIVSLAIGVDTEGFNIRNPVASNPAYFMDPLEHKFLYGLLSAADVFSLWVVILMGVGYASVSKLKTSNAIYTVLAAFLLFKVIAAGIGAL